MDVEINPGQPDDSAQADYTHEGLTRKEFIGAAGGVAATTLALGPVGQAAAHAASAPAREQAAATKKTIVQAMGIDIDQIDPHYFKSIPGYYAVANLYDMMLDYQLGQQPDGGWYPVADKSGNWKYTSWLAQSVNVSSDSKTITFHLRKDATFSDGTPLTSKDVKATWDRAITGQGYANVVMGFMSVSHPSQVTTPDDYTVVVHLSKPNVFALKMFAVNVLSIMSADALKAHATSADPTAHNFFKTQALGSTAYVLKSWTPGVQWELQPNPHYWNASALQNAGTIIRTIPNPTERYNLLVKGDIDIAYDLNPKDLATLRNHPDIQLIQFKVPWPYYMGMTNTVKPFDNPKVRQAVSYSIPYQTIIDKVIYGFGQVCKSPVAAGMPTSDFSASPYTTNPAKTKQLLQQAGISNLSFDLAVQQGRAQDSEIAVWIQASLQQAGVQMNIVPMNAAEYYAKSGNHQLQAFIGEFYSWVNDPFYHMYWNFLSTNPATNATNYNNPKVDKMILSGVYDTNIARRNALSHQIQRVIMQDAPWALLFQTNYTIAVRKNIQGFNWYPDVGTRFWRVSKS